MGFFTNAVHNIGQMAGQAGRSLEKGISAGFGAARRVVHGARQVGNTISRVAKKANDLTGGALDVITDAIPGGRAVKGAFKVGLNVVNKADTALSRAEGAFNKGRKRVREVAGKISSAAQSAARTADTFADKAVPAAKRLRTQVQSGIAQAKNEARKIGSEIRSGFN